MNFFSCFFFLFLNCCNEITIFQKYYLVKIHNELKIARNKIVAKIGKSRLLSPFESVVMIAS